jgi:hypothetical protein
VAVPFTPPEFRKTSFNCPFCGAFAQQHWHSAFKRPENVVNPGITAVPDFYVSVCAHCDKHAIWFQPAQRPIPQHLPDPVKAVMALSNKARLVFPAPAQGPLPNPDLPDDIKADFLEARGIAAPSPRGASALLRLCIQKLCKHLGEPGENLHADIGALVARGLPKKIQQALDTVRVVGNGAVHPGELDLRDDLPTALRLMDLVNIIADVMITQPHQVEALYDKMLTPGQKEVIAKRDESDEGKK